MTRKLVLAIGLLVFILALTSSIEIHTVKARPVARSDLCDSVEDSDYEGMAMIPNVQTIDDMPYNLSFPTHRFRHWFGIDYFIESPDFSGTALDITDNLGTSAIPEFPSFLMMLLFMAASLFGVALLKMHVKKSSMA
jgi:hypothetical protein